MHKNSQAVMVFDTKFVANTLRSFLKCPSCRNEFTFSHFQQELGSGAKHTRSNRPILMPCGHSMCENCIQQNYKNLVCSQCTRPLPVPKRLWSNFKFRQMFEQNFFLMGTIKHITYYSRPDADCDVSILPGSKRIHPILKCIECDTAAAFGKCNQCNANYCKNCFKKVHMNSKVLKSHSIIALELQQPRMNFNKPHPKTCRRHRKTCDRYCRKCHNTYCRLCIKADHINHNHCSLVEQNENNMDEIITLSEIVKQTREKVRKAQREIKSVESQFQDYATQTLEDVAQHFWEMHGLLQLEFRKIVQSFHESCAAPQHQLREAFDSLNDGLNVLNKMRSCLESYEQAPSNIDLTYVAKSFGKQIISINTDVKITKIDKNPFVFEKSKDFKRDVHQFFSYKYEAPEFGVCVGPSNGFDWQSKMCEAMSINGNDNDYDEQSILADTTIISNEVVENPLDMNDGDDDSVDDDDTTMEDLSAIIKEIVKQPKKKPNLKEFTTILANISYIKSPSYFFIQKVDLLPKLYEVTSKYEHVESELLPQNISINNIYMGFHDQTKQWYRIIVVKMLNENLVKAFLVDVGADLEMNRKNIRKLDQKYADIEFAAIPCALYNIEPNGEAWPQSTKDLMTDISCGKPVRAYIFGKKKNDIRSVDLLTTYDDEPISIRDAFLYMGLAREMPGVSQSPSNIRKINPVCPLTRQFMKYNLVPGDTFSVKVVHVENPMEFYVMRSDFEEKNVSLHKELNSVYNDKGLTICRMLLYLVSLKMRCSVRFNGVWYRGSVEEIEGNGFVRVRFVDEGRTEVVKWDCLYQLEPRFCSAKEFAIRCSLFEIEPLQENNYSWSSEAIEEFQMLIRHPCTCVRVDQIIQNINRVTLYISKKNTEVNIGALLVRKGYALSTGTSTQNYDIPKKKATTGLKFDLQNQEELDSFTKLLNNEQKQSNVKILERVPIKIEHIVSPGELYIYLTSLEEGVKHFHTQLQISQKDKNEDSDSKNSSGIKVWSIGDHCLVHTVYRNWLKLINRNCASTNSDEKLREWYRAIVVDIKESRNNEEDQEKMTYTVFLRDKGATISDIGHSHLYDISRSWDYVSNSVQRCHLACLEPTGDTKIWSMTSSDALKHNTTKFHALLATRYGEPLPDTMSIPIFLWGMNSESVDALAPSVSKYTNINRLLFKMGLASKSELLVVVDQSNMIMEMGIEDSNQISLDEWYKKRSGNEFLDAIERMAIIDRNRRNEISMDDAEPIEPEQNNNNESLLNDIDIKPTWCQIAPAEWYRAKLISKTIFTAYPTNVNFSAVVFLHEAADHEFLSKMRDLMTEAYKDTPFNSQAMYTIGQPCVVKYHFDGQFYRGIVQSVDNRVEEEYEVLFIDYGNKENVKASELRPYAPFRKLNAFAKKYRIVGIRPVGGLKKYPLASLDVMHNILVDKLVSVRVNANSIQKKIPYCSIRVGAEDFAEIFVREGRAEYRSGVRTAPLKTERIPQLTLPIQMDLSEYDTANDSDSQSSDQDDDQDDVDENVEDIDIDDNDKAEINPPNSNDSSLEYELPKLISANELKGTFKSFDFKGDIARPTAYCVNQIEENANGKCDLENTATAAAAAKKENSCINLLDEDDDIDVVLEESLLSNYWRDYSVTDANNDGDDDDDDVPKNDDEEELAIQWSHIKALQHRARSESSCEFENFRPQDTSSTFSHFADFDLFKWPKLPTNVRSFRCDIHAVVSPTMLYIFPHLKDFQERDKEIKWLIKKAVQVAKPLANFTPNTMCLAFYKPENNWYRAIIRSFNSETLEAHVLFIDYWNTENISIKYLKQCPMKFLDCPLRTLKVKLHGVQPTLGLRERHVCQALRKVLKNCRDLFVQVQIHTNEIVKATTGPEPPIEVHIFESESASNTIYFDLIKKKLYKSV